jgi:hypothetical protein
VNKANNYVLQKINGLKGAAATAAKTDARRANLVDVLPPEGLRATEFRQLLHEMFGITRTTFRRWIKWGLERNLITKAPGRNSVYLKVTEGDQCDTWLRAALEKILPLSIRWRRKRYNYDGPLDASRFRITEKQILSDLIDAIRPILHHVWLNTMRPVLIHSPKKKKVYRNLNSQKTCCPKGHPYDRVYRDIIDGGIRRRCRLCKNEQKRNRNKAIRDRKRRCPS